MIFPLEIWKILIVLSDEQNLRATCLTFKTLHDQIEKEKINNLTLKMSYDSVGHCELNTKHYYCLPNGTKEGPYKSHNIYICEFGFYKNGLLHGPQFLLTSAKLTDKIGITDIKETINEKYPLFQKYDNFLLKVPKKFTCKSSLIIFKEGKIIGNFRVFALSNKNVMIADLYYDKDGLINGKYKFIEENIEVAIDSGFTHYKNKKIQFLIRLRGIRVTILFGKHVYYAY